MTLFLFSSFRQATQNKHKRHKINIKQEMAKAKTSALALSYFLLNVFVPEESRAATETCSITTTQPSE
jgi:hypothetical protein